MIHTFIPYATNDRNLGAAYNKSISLIGDDDWACLLDHDAMFTVGDWYYQLNEIVSIAPNAGLLTCVCNRVGNREQVIEVDGGDINNHDIYLHRSIGRRRSERYRLELRECVNPISGVVILTSKRAWQRAGGFSDGFFGVDNRYDLTLREAGYRNYIMDGVYCYHWYRGDGQPQPGWQYPDNAHLPPITQRQSAD